MSDIIYPLYKTVIERCALATGGINAFGEGTKSYANLDKNREMFPRAWMFPVEVSEEIKDTGSLTAEYVITMDFGALVKAGCSQEDLWKATAPMFTASREFILRLADDPDVKSVENIKREPQYHVLDKNLAGWLLKFNLVLKETIVYPC